MRKLKKIKLYNFMNPTLVFNHYYKLKHDIKRVYIIGDNQIKEMLVDISFDCLLKVHPFYGMLFSFFSEPILYSKAVKQISYFLDIPESNIKSLLEPFLNNPNPFYTEYKGVKYIFPKNIIIDADNAFTKPHKYNIEDFKFNPSEIDIESQRCIKSPLGLVFMINNKCATSCIYCYADKHYVKSELDFKIITKIIKEAKNLNIIDFNISGGEIFLYKNWYKLLQLLNKYEYQPSLLSTKLPLTESVIIKLKDFNIPIQISLDSLNPFILSRLLNVNNDYYTKIKATIELLNKHKIKFQISTVLTKYNCSINELNKMNEFIEQLNVSRWEIRTAFRSLYSSEYFDSFKVNKNELIQAENWIEETKKKSQKDILWMPNLDKKYRVTKNGSANFIGDRCSANYSHAVILPDGKVTICEQMYWNPRFIIGDLNENSIEDVWNSKRALELAFRKQNTVQDASPCKQCKIYDQCVSYSNKCFADTIKAYGDINWDYPDPRCIDAPNFTNSLT